MTVYSSNNHIMNEQIHVTVKGSCMYRDDGHVTNARLNQTTGPLSPMRFEASAHHQAGSCTQCIFWRNSWHIDQICFASLGFHVPWWWARHVRKVESNNWAAKPPEVWSLSPPPGGIMHTNVYSCQTVCDPKSGSLRVTYRGDVYVMCTRLNWTTWLLTLLMFEETAHHQAESTQIVHLANTMGPFFVFFMYWLRGESITEHSLIQT